MNIDIVVITYNRKENLLKTLSAITREGVPAVARIYILDNASDYDVVKEVERIIPLSLRSAVKIIRNTVNLGMSANILRAFEQGTGDYLYIMADDDRVEPGFMVNLINEVSQSRNLDAIKLGSKNSFLLQSVNDFYQACNSADNFNSHIFLSNIIYRRESIVKYLKVGYENADSYVPHFLMLVSMVRDGGKIGYVTCRLVTYVVPSMGYNYALVAGLGVGSLKRVILGTNRKETKQFHGLFYPHNDFKVLIDLRYQCLCRGSKYDYVYLSKHYLGLVRPHRNWVHCGILVVMRILIKRERLFMMCFKSKLLPISIKSHLTEMQEKYAESG